MKKSVIWISVILLILAVVFVCIPQVFILLFHNTSMWAYSADYNNYADDFRTVKNYIQTEYPEETDKWLDVSHSGDHGHRLYDPDVDGYLEIPSDVLSSLDVICDHGFPYKDAVFDVIRIHGDRISFCIENGQYALVFSPNEKPSWVNSPNENSEVKVKSIGDGWYHVTKRPG